MDASLFSTLGGQGCLGYSQALRETLQHQGLSFEDDDGRFTASLGGRQQQPRFPLLD